jgi:hypothetical protein
MPTRWSPDTCDCVMITEAGATESDFPTLVTAEYICPIHSGLSSHTAVYNTVKDENPRKNKAFQQLIDNSPAGMFDLDAESGTKVLKKGITLDWSWTGIAPTRVIVFTLTGITLTTNQRNNAQSLLNSTFGAGKAVLVNN